MGASLRRLYDISIEKREKFNKKIDKKTDFDRNSRYCFLCSGKKYIFSYSLNEPLCVSIEEEKEPSVVLDD